MIARYTLVKLIEGCDDLISWNENITSANDWVTSPEGMQKLAGNAMVIESIGEGVKKIENSLPDFFESNCPDIDWRSLKGMRDRIAHGYFEIDAELIFEAIKYDIPVIKSALEKLQNLLQT